MALSQAAQDGDIEKLKALLPEADGDELDILCQDNFGVLVGSLMQGGGVNEEDVTACVEAVQDERVNRLAQKWAAGWNSASSGSVDDSSLAAVVEELAALNPATTPPEVKLGFARRLLRGISWEKMLEASVDSTSFNECQLAIGPMAALSLRGDMLKAARLYSTQASPVESIDGFVSYTWGADMKVSSRQLTWLMLDSFGRNNQDKLVHAQLWLDRFSSPQEGVAYEQAQRFAFFFNEYIALCPRCFVIFSPQYATRLWCRYEFATFLALHPVNNMYAGWNFFLYDDDENPVGTPWEVFVASIRDSSVDTAACKYESDRAILLTLINENFTNATVFDELVRYSLVALLARATFLKEHKTSCRAPDSTYQRLVRLAAQLAFADLSEGLAEIHTTTMTGSLDNFNAYSARAQLFEERVVPLMRAKQDAALLPDSHLKSLRALIQN